MQTLNHIESNKSETIMKILIPVSASLQEYGARLQCFSEQHSKGREKIPYTLKASSFHSDQRILPAVQNKKVMMMKLKC